MAKLLFNVCMDEKKMRVIFTKCVASNEPFFLFYFI